MSSARPLVRYQCRDADPTLTGNGDRREGHLSQLLWPRQIQRKSEWLVRYARRPAGGVSFVLPNLGYCAGSHQGAPYLERGGATNDPPLSAHIPAPAPYSGKASGFYF